MPDNDTLLAFIGYGEPESYRTSSDTVAAEYQPSKGEYKPKVGSKLFFSAP